MNYLKLLIFRFFEALLCFSTLLCLQAMKKQFIHMVDLTYDNPTNLNLYLSIHFRYFCPITGVFITMYVYSLRSNHTKMI